MSAIDALAITSLAVAAIVTAPSYAGHSTMASHTADETSITGHDSARQNSSNFRGSLHFKQYKPQEADVRSSDVIGLAVYNLSNQKIGLVDDLILGTNQIVKGIVINVGGFLGSGNRDIAVTASSILLLKRGNKLDRALIDATVETLKSADTFEFSATNRVEPAVSSTPPNALGKP